MPSGRAPGLPLADPAISAPPAAASVVLPGWRKGVLATRAVCRTGFGTFTFSAAFFTGAGAFSATFAFAALTGRGRALTFWTTLLAFAPTFSAALAAALEAASPAAALAASLAASRAVTVSAAFALPPTGRLETTSPTVTGF